MRSMSWVNLVIFSLQHHAKMAYKEAVSKNDFIKNGQLKKDWCKQLLLSIYRYHRIGRRYCMVSSSFYWNETLAISVEYFVKRDIKVLWTCTICLIDLLYSKCYFLDCRWIWIRTLCCCNSSSQLIGFQLSINSAYLRVLKHLTLTLKETRNSYFCVTTENSGVSSV